MDDDDRMLLAVNGTLMRGLALEKNMTRAGATFESEALTERAYRLWSVNDLYPAMIRVGDSDAGAAQIAVEVWSVPPSGIAAILAGEPAGLSIGKVRLDDGRVVFGVIGEPEVVKGMKEITSYGGWRRYMNVFDRVRIPEKIK